MSKILIVVNGVRSQPFLRQLAGDIANNFKGFVKEVICDYSAYRLDVHRLVLGKEVVVLTEHVVDLPPRIGPDSVPENQRIGLTFEEMVVIPPITLSGIPNLISVAVIGNDGQHREFVLKYLDPLVRSLFKPLVAKPLGNESFSSRFVTGQTEHEASRELTVEVLVHFTDPNVQIGQILKRAEEGSRQ